MDFSSLAATLNEIVAKQNQPDPNFNPYAIPKPTSFPQLDADQKLKDIQKQKKESELSHKAKVARNKRIERAQGYMDKMEKNEKLKNKRKIDKAKNKRKKRAAMENKENVE